MASTVLKWLGFNRAFLAADARTAVDFYSQNGAVKVSVVQHKVSLA